MSPHRDAPHLLASTVAPFLTAYVDWVLREAEGKGIKRLYFVARDGQIMYRLAQRIVAKRGGPDLCYLYGSRRAWLLPSISHTDATWRRLVVTPAQKNSLSDIAGRLALDVSDAMGAGTAIGLGNDEAERPLSKTEANRLLDHLFEAVTTRHQLEAKIGASHAITSAYLAQEGLLDDVSWALVDAGWSLNCQAALKRILVETNGAARQPQGFYIGLAKDFLRPETAGIAFPMIPVAGSIFSRRRVVIEHFFTPATHASTAGYCEEGQRIVPVFSDETRTDGEVTFATKLQEKVLAFADEAIEQGYIEPDTFKQRSISKAAKFLTNPRRSAVTSLLSFQAIADLRHEIVHKQPLCKPLSWNDVTQIVLAAVVPARVMQPSVSLWLEGAAAVSSPTIRLAVRAMLFADNTRNRLKCRQA